MSTPGTSRDRQPLPTRPRSDLADETAPAARRRAGVKLLATDGNRVLMTKETRADGPDFWTLPGGGLHASESPREGLKREVAEELGGDAVVGGPVARCAYRHTSRPDTVSVYTVFVGSVRGAIEPNPAEGIVDYHWTTLPTPENTLRPFRRVIREHAPSGAVPGRQD